MSSFIMLVRCTYKAREESLKMMDVQVQCYVILDLEFKVRLYIQIKIQSAAMH